MMVKMCLMFHHLLFVFNITYHFYVFVCKDDVAFLSHMVIVKSLQVSMRSELFCLASRDGTRKLCPSMFVCFMTTGWLKSMTGLQLFYYNLYSS